MTTTENWDLIDVDTLTGIDIGRIRYQANHDGNQSARRALRRLAAAGRTQPDPQDAA